MTEQAKIDRNRLVYRKSMETSLRQGAAQKIIIEYLEAVGYEQSQSTPSMKFERGATFSGLFHPDPRLQRAEMTIDLVSMGTNTIAEVVLAIPRFRVQPNSVYAEFWDAELDGLAQALRYNAVEARLSVFAAERAMWSSIAAILLVVLIFLILLAAFVWVGTVLLPLLAPLQEIIRL